MKFNVFPTNEGFRPVSITITLESKAEAEALTALIDYSSAAGAAVATIKGSRYPGVSGDDIDALFTTEMLTALDAALL